MSNIFTVFASFPMHGRSKTQQAETFVELERNARLWFRVAKACDFRLVNDYDEVRVISNLGASGEDTDGRLHYLGQAIMKLDKVDAAIFADDWKEHKGCSVEYKVCRLYDIPIIRRFSIYTFESSLLE